MGGVEELPTGKTGYFEVNLEKGNLFGKRKPAISLSYALQLEFLLQTLSHRRGLQYLPQTSDLLFVIRDISAHNKDLVRFPSLIGRFSSLEVLTISGNELLNIPSEIGDINTLTKLNFQRTGINTVPSSFGQLNNLTELDLTQNPITSIPQEVCNLQISNGGILTILTDDGDECD